MKKIKKKTSKLNLIPILDAIFIFIFFLLMSAQFIDMYEIGTDKPITSTLSNNDNKKDPLNLTIKMNKTAISIFLGMTPKLYKSYSYQELNEYRTDLQKIKAKHPKETSAILKPTTNVSYKKIVNVIDYTKEQSINGRKVALFEQVIFNTEL